MASTENKLNSLDFYEVLSKIKDFVKHDKLRNINLSILSNILNINKYKLIDFIDDIEQKDKWSN